MLLAYPQVPCVGTLASVPELERACSIAWHSRRTSWLPARTHTRQTMSPSHQDLAISEKERAPFSPPSLQ